MQSFCIIGAHESMRLVRFPSLAALNMDRRTATTDNSRIVGRHIDDGAALHAGPIPIVQNRPDSNSETRRQRTIYCFSCNRQESHFVSAYSRFILILAVMLSLGLYVFFGQYRCHCCSSSRLMRYDFLNPKYWYRKFQLRRDGVKKRRRRRSKRRR